MAATGEMDWDAAWDYVCDIVPDIEAACAQFTEANEHWIATVVVGNYPPRFSIRAYVPSPADKRYTEVHVGEGIMARRHVPEEWAAEVSQLIADLVVPRDLRPYHSKRLIEGSWHPDGTMSGLLYWELRPDYEKFRKGEQ